ncbi:hypothetical protein BFP97_09490 [Roseivirga sp. 4D4]|uniref:hypothetical protein n=1 Tax=Roseivirga sp. 4D4 TaxID=1889784 RepID=UPI000852B403|nr:hypothetical protein [Roseivirga sp. 4D4]OEK01733.1 hypothetical protein BFP97_09490 [Roseivirga sp. 4D4]
MKFKKSYLLILFSISLCLACQQDEDSELPVKQEVRREIVSSQDIPHIVDDLFNQLNLGNDQKRFSVNDGGQNITLDIDLDRILRTADSLGRETYSIQIENLSASPFTFYNLILKYNEQGEVFEPFVMRYVMDEEFIPEYLKTRSMSDFSGSVTKLILTKSSNNNSSSAAPDPSDPTAVLFSEECPFEEMIDGGGGSTAPGGNTGTSSSLVKVCELSMHEEVFYTLNCTPEGCDISSYERTPVYTRTCYYTYSNHTEVAGSSNECEEEGEIPILLPDGLILDSSLSLLPCSEQIILDLASKGDPLNWSAALKNDTHPEKNQKIGHISADILNFFNDSGTYNLSFQVGDAGKDNQGNDLNANTNRISKTNFMITLDEERLKNSTSLGLASTILHEAMHGYLSFSIYNGSEDPGTNQALQDLYNSLQPKKLDIVMTQHEFISDYVDAMAYSLSVWDDHKQDMSYYRKLSWGGLHETTAYQSLHNSKKYDIRDANEAERKNSNKAKGDSGC